MLTRNQRDAIDALAWGTLHFGSLHTNRVVRRRTVLSLVRRGLAESVGQTMVCDADGFHVEPERYREGFRLTARGQKVYEHQLRTY